MVILQNAGKNFFSQVIFWLPPPPINIKWPPPYSFYISYTNRLQIGHTLNLSGHLKIIDIFISRYPTISYACRHCDWNPDPPFYGFRDGPTTLITQPLNMLKPRKTYNINEHTNDTEDEFSLFFKTYFMVVVNFELLTTYT